MKDLFRKSIYVLALRVHNDSLLFFLLKNGHPELFHEIPLSSRIVDNGKILDHDTLGLLLSQFLDLPKVKDSLSNAHPISVLFCIPESHIFADVFSLPKNTPQENIRNHILKKSLGVMPYVATDVYWDYQYLRNRKNGDPLFLYVAVRREILLEYSALFRDHGLVPSLIGIDSMMLANAVLPNDHIPTLIFDIQKFSSVISIFDETGNLNNSYTILIGGEDLSRAITERLKINITEAEHLKMTNGFDPSIKENRTLVILQERVQLIMRELEKAINLFEKQSETTISRVLLSGEGALIPFFVEYMKSNLRREVKKIDPLLYSKGLPENFTETHQLSSAHLIGIARAYASKKNNFINFAKRSMEADWSQEENMLRKHFATFAVPLCTISIILFFYVTYIFLYLPQKEYRHIFEGRINPNVPQRILVTSLSEPMQIDTGSPDESFKEDPHGSIESSLEEMETTVEVTILSTPTGWLNVRRDPFSYAEILGKVYPGEMYLVSTRTNGWIHIRNNEEVIGWISQEYAE